MIRMSRTARKSKRESGVTGRAAASIVVLSTVSQACCPGQAAVCSDAGVCYVEIGGDMQIEDVKITSRSNPSQRIIAAAIVFAFLYFASEVVVPLLLAVLMAYFLDPVVGIFDRIHIPRALGALVVMFAVTAMLAGLGYLVSLRADQFIADWPRYSA